MSAVMVKPDVDSLELLDFEPACELSEVHDLKLFGHEGPAAFLVSCPGGVNRLLCAGSVGYIKAWGGVSCEPCESKHTTAEMRFIPLEESCKS